MDTFSNSEDPDEMQQNAAFHQSLHYSLKQTRSPEIFKGTATLMISMFY